MNKINCSLKARLCSKWSPKSQSKYSFNKLKSKVILFEPEKSMLATLYSYDNWASCLEIPMIRGNSYNCT